MKIEAPEAENEHEQFRRFDANMYEAHTDTVEAKEIRQWQTAFPFIRVVGTGYSVSSAGDEQKDDEQYEWVATKSPVPPPSSGQNDSFSRSFSSQRHRLI